jgi:hypothetical protein
MLAIHWTPVSNTKKILKNGIRKSKKGLFCFPLTGYKQLDKWWVTFFNQNREKGRKKYNGIVFRIKKEDFPAYFGYWYNATNRHDFKKEITNLKSFGAKYRTLLLWRMGMEIAKNENLVTDKYDCEMIDKLYLELADKEIMNETSSLNEKINSIENMRSTLYDFQIVLSNSISAERILKVLPLANESGKVSKQKKKFNTKEEINTFHER